MCYEVSAGGALVSMSHSAIDLFDAQFPSKPESKKIDALLSNSYADLESLRKRLERFEQEERSGFRSVHDIEQRILAVTSAEVLIISISFGIEFLIFKKYLSNFSII